MPLFAFLFCKYGEKSYFCIAETNKTWYLGRVARHRSAKPPTAVRIRQIPHKSRLIKGGIFLWIKYLDRNISRSKMLFLRQIGHLNKEDSYARYVHVIEKNECVLRKCTSKLI